jgi:hypothetical protein
MGVSFQNKKLMILNKHSRSIITLSQSLIKVVISRFITVCEEIVKNHVFESSLDFKRFQMFFKLISIITKYVQNEKLNFKFCHLISIF